MPLLDLSELEAIKLVYLKIRKTFPAEMEKGHRAQHTITEVSQFLSTGRSVKSCFSVGLYPRLPA